METIEGTRTPEVIDLLLTGERRMRVRVWPGTGRPLVLLHGLLDDSLGWAQLAMDTHRPCVAIDLPGFGDSDVPTRPRISAYAEAVCEGVEQLDVGPCTVVGHSLGGAVAVSMAESCEPVTSVALLAPAGFGHIRLAEAMSLPGIVQAAELSLPLALVNPLTVTAAYSAFVAHGRLPSRDLMDRIVRRSFRSGPGVRMAVQAISAAGRSPRGYARRGIGFHGPVAARWGEHDALVSLSHREALARALPQAHIVVWPGLGHHPQRERPAELARFIERHAARGRDSRSRRIVARAA
jgi:pimeloyl-ACP methyl ester carboxylesterase